MSRGRAVGQGKGGRTQGEIREAQRQRGFIAP